SVSWRILRVEIGGKGRWKLPLWGEPPYSSLEHEYFRLSGRIRKARSKIARNNVSAETGANHNGLIVHGWGFLLSRLTCAVYIVSCSTRCVSIGKFHREIHPRPSHLICAIV